MRLGAMSQDVLLYRPAGTPAPSDHGQRLQSIRYTLVPGVAPIPARLAYLPTGSWYLLRTIIGCSPS